VQIRARQHALTDARHRSTVALGVVSAAFAIVIALLVARPDSLPTLPILGVLALSGAAVALSLHVEVIFLGWLALAPLLQNSADATAIGHVAVLALYVAPTLVFAFWTLTGSIRFRSARVVDVLPLIYLLYVLVWLLLSSSPSSTALKGAYTTVAIGIILYYFLAFGPIGSLSWESVTVVLLALSALEALMSIVDSLTAWNLWQDAGWQQGLPRAVATLANPAVLGAFIGIGIVLALAVLVWGAPAPHLRKLAIATIVLGLPGIFVTYTRAPILAMVVVGLAILVSRAQTRLIALCSLITAAVVLTLSWGRITESPVYRERVTNESNIEGRLLLQDWSLQLAGERPLFGWGYNSYDRVKNSARLSSGNVPRSFGDPTSHNTFLTVLVEYGAVGLILMLLPWLVIIWRAVRDALARSETSWFLVGSIAVVAVYLINASTVDMRFFSFVPAVPWLLLGLLRRTQLSRSLSRLA
jgi:O-antigen ligase